jgi:hypothetical protein
MEIKFYNHASVSVIDGNTEVRSDPWDEGPAFINGWRLKAEVDQVDTANSYFLSHEHPDHFRPGFWTGGAKSRIFCSSDSSPKMRDFLRAKGHEVNQLGDEEVRVSENLLAKIGSVGGLDSWMAFRRSSTSSALLNLNDCVVTKSRLPQRLAEAAASETEVLATQFSPAQWLGNEEDHALTQQFRARSLERLFWQVNLFRPSFVLPFASFVNRVRPENVHENLNVVRLSEAFEVIQAAGGVPLAFLPGETRPFSELGNPTLNQNALEYWESQGTPGASYDPPVIPLEQLESAAWASCVGLRETLGRSKELLRQVVGEPTELWIDDLECSVVYDCLDGTKKGHRDRRECDASMRSDVFLEIVKFNYGRGSALVAGLVRANYTRFERFMAHTRARYLLNVESDISPYLVQEQWKEFNTTTNIAEEGRKFGRWNS